MNFSHLNVIRERIMFAMWDSIHSFILTNFFIHSIVLTWRTETLRKRCLLPFFNNVLRHLLRNRGCAKIALGEFRRRSKIQTHSQESWNLMWNRYHLFSSRRRMSAVVDNCCPWSGSYVTGCILRWFLCGKKQMDLLDMTISKLCSSEPIGEANVLTR